jgi:hypothetical protein
MAEILLKVAFKHQKSINKSKSTFKNTIVFIKNIKKNF